MGVDSSTSLWNNTEAGNHPLPDVPREALASIRAAERCMKLLPYLGIRFGKRGDAFARTDSGYLTTLVRFPQEYVLEQVQWLARVLSSRGMPRWLMEVHLEILAEELITAIPENAADYRKLREAASALRQERQAVLSQESFDHLAIGFAQQAGTPITYFGETILSAVCDEACGIDGAVPAITTWLESNYTLPTSFRAAVAGLLGSAYQAARVSRE
jgi:hypothetical protein